MTYGEAKALDFGLLCFNYRLLVGLLPVAGSFEGYKVGLALVKGIAAVL